MNSGTASLHSGKEVAVSPGSNTNYSSRRFVATSPKTLSPRAAETVTKADESTGNRLKNESGSGSGLALSIKSFRRKKYIRGLHPLESESPRHRPHNLQEERYLSVAPSSPHIGTTIRSPRFENGVTRPEDSDDEILQLQRLHAHLASGETVEEWIRSYELERGNFASFAVFTEVKIDEVQEGYVEQVGRPNAVEAAACCATLLKMPGIVGCYKTLLEKMSAGIQGAIYLPENSPPLSPTIESPDAMAELVQRFYSRTPYFERVRDLEKTLRESRSITDPNVLRAVSSDDVARIFQFVPFHHVQTGIAKVYATNSSMLDQLVNVLQEQQGLLLLRRKGLGPDDPDYPVHVPLATSAQICRAITQNAGTFSSSGREMILCAIVDLVDVDSFRDVFQHFDVYGKTCFLHHLSVTESTDQLQLVVDALPSAGESLFRLYLATCSGGIFSDVQDEKGPGGEPVPPTGPKDVFFLKLLSPDMEFFFVSDLAAYLTEAQWQLLSKEFEKNEKERKARKLRRVSMNAGTDIEIEIDEDEHDGRPMSSSAAAASIDRFQMIMVNYLRHHNLSSAQLLQLVANTFLSMLNEKEFSQLIDKCWSRFTLDGQWSKVLAVVQDLGTGRGIVSPSSPGAPADEANYEYIAAIRFKLLKKIFMMLTREERGTWMDRLNAKYPTENYKKKMQDMKNALTLATNKPSDLSDPGTHIPNMKSELKMRWLEAVLEAMLSDPEHSTRMTALKQVLHPFANGKTPPPPVSPPQQTKPTIASTEKVFQQLLSQLSAADKAALLAKFAPPPGDGSKNREKELVDRAASPIEFVQDKSSNNATVSPEIQKALQTLLERRPEKQVLEILQEELEIVKSDITTSVGSGPETSANSANLSGRLKRKLTAVNAVAEPMDWQEFVKVGFLDVGCQTTFESADVAGTPGAIVSTTSTRDNNRPVAPVKAPLTLTALLGKNGVSAGNKSKKDKYQKISSASVPRAISGLITSWRMNTDQLVQFAKKSLPQVLKIIADAYSEMLTTTRRKTQQQQLPYPTSRSSSRILTLSQIVYQSFLHSYGLPSIADMHLLAFSCALESYRLQHLRVEFFARFCFDEVPKSGLSNYLEFLECTVCDDPSVGAVGTNNFAGPVNTPSSGNTVNLRGISHQLSSPMPPITSKRPRFVPRVSIPDRENWLISLDRAQDIAQLCFRDMRKTAVTAFCENLANIAALGTSTAVLPVPKTSTTLADTNGSELLLNVDHLLQLVLLEWKQEQSRREHHLLDVFRAGDVNGDGQLTSAEFTQIVLSIDAARDLGDILLMYSDTLRRTECEQLNAEVFLQVAREHELDRVVWQGDGDLFGVFNEVTDMEATWAHVRGFFVGTLEALARDLSPNHFLRVCEGAGCGCLKCLLDGYVGFQKMRREFETTQKHHQQHQQTPYLSRRNSYVGVSSQLVWARFWHLMRQLHDAAAESDGILTPWEGASYNRENPIQPLAPRSNNRRRDSLPNFLFPDTARITAKMSPVHDPEAFDAPTIHDQFAYLLSHVSAKEPEAISRS